MKKILTMTIFAITFFIAKSFAQSDALKIAEAQYALKKNPSDCKVAKQALDEVSEEGKLSRLYTYFIAKTYDCLDKFDDAITYYTKYLEFVPNDAEIIQRLAELSYKKRKVANRKLLFGDWLKSDNSLIYEILQFNDSIHITYAGKLKFAGIILAESNEVKGKFYDIQFDKFRINSKTNSDFCEICKENKFTTSGKLKISDDGNTLKAYCYPVYGDLEYEYRNGEKKVRECCKIYFGQSYEYAYDLHKQ